MHEVGLLVSILKSTKWILIKAFTTNAFVNLTKSQQEHDQFDSGLEGCYGVVVVDEGGSYTGIGLVHTCMMH